MLLIELELNQPTLQSKEESISSRTILFGVVHLKAGNFQQFKELLQIMSEYKNTDIVIVGDFNFKDIENEVHEELDAAFDDFWVMKHPGVAGFTYDLERNPLAKSISDLVSQVKKTVSSSSRFDRILLSKQNKILKPGINQMRIIENDDIYL
jgi:endonuclease/exonuclease/phosphatase family metal-dependent hydrolase